MNIADRVEKLNDHFKERFHYLDDIEHAIANKLIDFEMELSIEELLSSLVEM